jgi:membrane protein DedA with SNARE-associated domain
LEGGFTQDLLNWISENPAWSGLLIFLVAWIESMVVIGILLPGIFILFGIGAMIGLGVLDFYPVWLAATLGALFGDIISYAIGYRLKGHLADFWPFSRYPNMLDRGRRFFHRHGSKSVIAGRFIGPLRPVIPATAGMLSMSPRQFLGVAIPACILWAPAYLLPGMLFGASLEVAEEYTGRLSLVLIIVVVVLWMTWWLIRSSYEFLVVRSARWLRRAISWTRKHPVLGRLTGPVLDPTRPELLSVSMLGLLLVLMVWVLIMLLFLSPFSDQPRTIDQSVLELAQTMRNHVADPVMVAITQLSRWSVLLPTAMAVLLWLLGAGRYSAAGHWLVAIGGGLILQFLLGWTLRSTPLLQNVGALKDWGPGPALTLTAVVVGFFSIMVAKELRRRSRQWPYLAAALLLSVLLVARIYLGLDWFSGALTGLFLGLAWTSIVGIAYRQRALLPFSGTVALGIFYSCLALTFYWQVNDHLYEDLEELRLPLPVKTMPARAWWQTGWQKLPTDLNRISRRAAKSFNFQVAVEPEEFAAALTADGWQTDDAADWTWLIRSLNPEPNADQLPMLAKDFLGHPEVLRLRRIDPVTDQLQTLRLWDSGLRLKPSGHVVYLGQAAEQVLVRRLKTLAYSRSTEPSRETLEQLFNSLGAFETQRVGERLLLVRPSGGHPRQTPAR